MHRAWCGAGCTVRRASCTGSRGACSACRLVEDRGHLLHLAGHGVAPLSKLPVGVDRRDPPLCCRRFHLRKLVKPLCFEQRISRFSTATSGPLPQPWPCSWTSTDTSCESPRTRSLPRPSSISGRKPSTRVSSSPGSLITPGSSPRVVADRHTSGLTTISSFPRSSMTLTATCRRSPASNGALFAPARWSHTLSS